MPSGFTPPSERSRSNRGDSHSDPDLGSRPLVPAAATIMVQRPGTSSSSRAVARTFTSQRSSNNDANASTSSSDGPRRPPQELSATQATFLAGAAVSHAHHASGVALQAARAAQDSQQRERQVVEQASLFGNALRHEARHVADAARQAVSQAQHSEQAARAQAQSAVQTLHQAASAAVFQAQQSEQALRAEAESAVSTIQQQADLRIAALEREVAQRERGTGSPHGCARGSTAKKVSGRGPKQDARRPNAGVAAAIPALERRTRGTSASLSGACTDGAPCS